MFTNIFLTNKAELISFLVSLWQIDGMSNSREEGLTSAPGFTGPSSRCLALCARPGHSGGGSVC